MKKVREFARLHHRIYDGSHDFTHIERVVKLARLIYNEAKRTTDPHDFKYDWNVTQLACLLHDVGDHKYMPDFEPFGVEPKNYSQEQRRELRREACRTMQRLLQDLGATDLYLEEDHQEATMMKNILLSFGAPPELAATVQEIIKGVSYSQEVLHPEISASILIKQPELAIVQDADRLDAVGAMGFRRICIFSEVKVNRGAKETLAVMDEKLFGRQERMKTDFGRREAEKRTKVLRTIRDALAEEIAIDDDVSLEDVVNEGREMLAEHGSHKEDEALS